MFYCKQMCFLMSWWVVKSEKNLFVDEERGEKRNGKKYDDERNMLLTS